MNWLDLFLIMIAVGFITAVVYGGQFIMTVWMHKGGSIILRYDNHYYGWYECRLSDEPWCQTYAYDEDFFKKHCVYIGKFD